MRTAGDQRVTFWGAQTDSARQAVIWLVVITAVIRLIGAGTIDLVLGESYYLSSARVLHWSYFDQPPLSLWIIWATKTLLQTEIPVLLRLPFVLMFSLSTWVVYRLGARYRSEWAGFIAALLTNISILFSLSIGSWLQPDAPLMLFWLLTVWALVDIFFAQDDTNAVKKWALVGLWLGLTFLSKYHAVFIVFGAGLFALTNKDARRWILHPGSYLALAIAALISVPVLIWNLQNDWASFGFQGGRALGTGFHADWLLRMVLGQLLYITPWIAISALVGAAITLFRGPRGVFPQETPSGFAWFLVCLALGPILLFTAISAWSDSQFHFHWQAPGYLMLFILLGGWIDAAWTRHRWLNRIWLSAAAALSLAAFAIVVSHSATGWLRNVLPNGQTMQDPTGETVEWRELRAVFDDMDIGNRDDVFVVAVNWQTCGQVDTPLAGRAPLACFTEDPRNIAFNINLRDMQGKDAYFADRWVSLKGVKYNFTPFFDNFEQVASVDITRNGFPELKNVQVVRATNFHLASDIYTGNASTVSVIRLPRTKLAKLSGEVFLPETIAEANVLIDGVVAGSIISDRAGTQAFDINVSTDKLTIGMSSAQITLMPVGDAGGAAFGFSRLKVQLD